MLRNWPFPKSFEKELNTYRFENGIIYYIEKNAPRLNFFVKDIEIYFNHFGNIVILTEIKGSMYVYDKEIFYINKKQKIPTFKKGKMVFVNNLYKVIMNVSDININYTLPDFGNILSELLGLPMAIKFREKLYGDRDIEFMINPGKVDFYIEANPKVYLNTQIKKLTPIKTYSIINI